MRKVGFAPAWSALATLAACGLAWPFVVDDAFIIARYARHIAQGAGYGMNPGQASDGVTAPLWLVPALLVEMMPVGPILSIDAMTAMKAVGLGCAVIATGAAVYTMRGWHGPRAAWATGAILAVQTSVAAWGVAGLETGAAILLVVAAMRGALSDAPSGGSLGVSLAALAWLRPESLALGAALVVAMSLRHRSSAMRAVVIWMAGVAALVAFRLAMFGNALPLSFYAKPADLVEGTSYVVRGVFATSGGVGLVAALVWGLRGCFRQRAMAWALIAHLAAVAFAGGDWMPSFRLLAPALPIYAGLLGAVAVGGSRPFSRLRFVCMVVAVFVSATDFALQLPRIRATAEPRRVAGAQLAARLQRYSTVAMVDVGFLGWKSGVEVVDLAGLTDPVIARAKGGYLAKQIPVGYMEQRAPDAILLHSAEVPSIETVAETRAGKVTRLRSLAGFPVERQIASWPWTRRHYIVAGVYPYAPGYYYVLLTRAEATSDADTDSESHAESPKSAFAARCRLDLGA